jgi:signal transduction histidine kinase
VSWLLSVLGWGVAVTLLLSLRRRISLVADAEHELRGAAAAIELAAERMGRTGSTAAFGSLVRLQLDRAQGALADLARARSIRPVAAPSELDAGRLAQVLANVIANAAEHGAGPVEVQAGRIPGAMRLQIRNRNRPPELAEAVAARRPGGRGRGLSIAERAAAEIGARVWVESGAGETVATVELPEDPAEGRSAGVAEGRPAATSVERSRGTAVEHSAGVAEGRSADPAEEGRAGPAPAADLRRAA